jgi:hypothetical protein
MAYTRPDVTVEYRQSAVTDQPTQRMPAHISGGNAFLTRFGETDERLLGRLGYYDPLQDTVYAWPNRPTGAKIDQAYTKLFAKNALLRYLYDDISGGSTIQRVAGKANRIRSATISFADNPLAPTTYPRTAGSLFSRDVQVGDIARVDYVDNTPTPQVLWTYVKSLIGEAVAAVTGSATLESGMPASPQSASVTDSFVDGVANCVDITGTATAYAGLASGFIDETYDLLVTQSSHGGNLATAKFKVISGSGTDDVAEANSVAALTTFNVGTRGLTAQWRIVTTSGCGDDATDAGLSTNDLLAGQRYRLTVDGAFTRATPTAAGTYVGTKDRIYLVEVTKGGLWAASPEITCRAIDGSDYRAPVVVANTTAVPVGTLGVTISFSGTGLRKGDRWTIAATAATTGAMKTIELGHSFPANVNATAAVGLKLYMKKDALEIPGVRPGASPIRNWTVDAESPETNGITVASAMSVHDASWHNNGTPLSLEIEANAAKGYTELFTEYRAWRQELIDQLTPYSSMAEIDAIPGSLDPDNPYKYGVYLAWASGGGATVWGSAVGDPSDADSWADMLAKLDGRTEVYNMAALTHDADIQALIEAHVVSQNGADKQMFRRQWRNVLSVPKIPIVAVSSTVPKHESATTSDGHAALGYFADDPETGGTQYTLWTVTSANADLQALGVRAGDVVRTHYAVDDNGDDVFDSYVIENVLGEDKLIVAAGPDAAGVTPERFEIWRNLNAAEEAEEIASQSASNELVMCVYPDAYEVGASSLPGYFLCAIHAGESSGILPQRSMLRHTPITVTGVSKTQRFGLGSLDLMAAAGIWLVVDDAQQGIIIRDSVTSAPSTSPISSCEEMMVRNRHSIMFRIRNELLPYLKDRNNTKASRANIKTVFDGLVAVLQAEEATDDLGGQIIGAEMVRIARHPTLMSHVLIEYDVELPVPIKGINVVLNETFRLQEALLV